MNSKVVYRPLAQIAEPAMNILRRNGLHPVRLDDPNPIMSYTSRGTFRVRIAVPAEEAREAKKILKAWEEASAESVGAITGQLRKHMLLSLAAAALAALVFRAACQSWSTVPWLGVGLIWFLSVIIIGMTMRNTDRTHDHR